MKRKAKRVPKRTVVGSIERPALANRVLKPIAMVVLAICLVLSTAIFFWWGYNKLTQNDDSSTHVCTDATLTQAAGLLGPEMSKELQQVVDQIKNQPNYQNDPNCMGIVTTYYVNISNAASARESYDQLAKVYNPEQGYNPIVGGLLAPDQLKPIVDFLGTQFEQIQKNSTSGPEVAPE